MTTRRNFLASIVAAVAMAPALLRFKAELPEVQHDEITVNYGEWSVEIYDETGKLQSRTVHKLPWHAQCPIGMI